MLNDYFFIQIFLLVTLFFINSAKDLFFSLLNAIIYLGLISIYAWLDDADIFINFLVIIDLGVFFILLAFTLNLTKLFTYSLSSTRIFYYSIYIPFFISFIFIIQFFISSNCFYTQQINVNFYQTFSYLITFYN